MYRLQAGVLRRGQPVAIQAKSAGRRRKGIHRGKSVEIAVLPECVKRDDSTVRNAFYLFFNGTFGQETALPETDQEVKVAILCTTVHGRTNCSLASSIPDNR